jgi:hypothetical protein
MLLPGKKHLGIWGILITLLWGCSGPDLVTEDVFRGQNIHPYVGLIRNFSARSISIPSQDSAATLILPAQGQMDYTVWKPNSDIYGYVAGKQVFYKNVRIEPHKKFTFFGNTYDFLVEVCADLPSPVIIPQQCPPPCPAESEPKCKSQSRPPKRLCPG